jgi:hypothetical protein
MSEQVESPELVAFVEEATAAEETLRAASGVDARLPGLGTWTLGELVGHLVGLAGRLDLLARAGTVTGPPALDRSSYFAACARTGQGFADPAVAPGEWAQRFGQAWRASARRFETLDPEVVLGTPYGSIVAVEYLATRVLEVVVHHLDVRAALDEPPVTTPAAGRLTLALLESLLEGPRPRNFGRTRFILAATGRIEVADRRFPVLR